LKYNRNRVEIWPVAEIFVTEVYTFIETTDINLEVIDRPYLKREGRGGAVRERELCGRETYQAVRQAWFTTEIFGLNRP